MAENMLTIKLAKIVSLNALLVIGWMLLFKVLYFHNNIDVWARIDSLWLTQVGDDLATNITGNLAYTFNTENGNGRVIYNAQYYPDGINSNPSIKHLVDMVDLSSWGKVSSDSVSITYNDKNFTYIVYKNSDGISMRIFNL